MTIVPAYGRDYKSKAAIQADLDSGKDFQINDMSSQWNGSYVNKPQLLEYGVKSVTVRYEKLRKVTILKIK